MVAKTSTARSLCHGDAGIRLQSPSASLPSNPLPYHGPYNSTHACVRGGRVTGCLNALWSSCVMRSVNSWWTCSNIGRYNSSPYDSVRYTQYRFWYDTDPIIVRSLITHNALHFYYGSRLSLMVNGEIEFAFLGDFMPYCSHLLLMLCKFSRLYVYVYGR